MTASPDVATLTDAELAALQRCRQRYGNWWKLAIRHQFLKGRCSVDPDGHIVEPILDEFGLDWLSTYKLPEAPCTG